MCIYIKISIPPPPALSLPETASFRGKQFIFSLPPLALFMFLK